MAKKAKKIVPLKKKKIKLNKANKIVHKYEIDSNILAMLYLDTNASAKIKFQIYYDGSMIIKIEENINKGSIAVNVEGINQIREFLNNIVPFLFIERA